MNISLALLQQGYELLLFKHHDNHFVVYNEFLQLLLL